MNESMKLIVHRTKQDARLRGRAQGLSGKTGTGTQIGTGTEIETEIGTETVCLRPLHQGSVVLYIGLMLVCGTNACFMLVCSGLIVFWWVVGGPQSDYNCKSLQ